MSGLDTVIGGKAGNPEAVKKHLDAAARLEKERKREAAIAELRAAREISDDQNVTFKLAYLLDLCGEENECVALYTELTGARKPHINALVNLAVWETTPWKEMKFSIARPHYYQYQYDNINEQSFTARAFGDVDSDNIIATFELTGGGNNNGEIVLSPPYTPQGEDNGLE